MRRLSCNVSAEGPGREPAAGPGPLRSAAPGTVIRRTEITIERRTCTVDIQAAAGSAKCPWCGRPFDDPAHAGLSPLSAAAALPAAQDQVPTTTTESSGAPAGSKGGSC